LGSSVHPPESFSSANPERRKLIRVKEMVSFAEFSYRSESKITGDPVKLGWITISRFVAEASRTRQRKMPARIVNECRGRMNLTAYRMEGDPAGSPYNICGADELI